MERLTFKNADTSHLENFLNRHSDFDGTKVADSLKRLAEYEDLGLTPEAVKDILTVISESQDDVDDNGISTGMLHDLLELAKYRKAEEQGLLIKLPCKVRDTLYGILLDEIKEYTVFAINIGLRKEQNSCVLLLKNHRNAVTSYELIDFGRTIFLTREEAEKKLAELEAEM